MKKAFGLASIALLALSACSAGGATSAEIVADLESEALADCGTAYSADLRGYYGLDFTEAAEAGVGASPALVTLCDWESDVFGSGVYELVVADSASNFRAVRDYACDTYGESELAFGRPFLMGSNFFIFADSDQPRRKILDFFGQSIGGESIIDACAA